jgi:hypothetical protein
MPDGLGTIAGTGPVRRTDVERDTGDNEFGVAVVPPGTQEAGRRGERGQTRHL